MQEVWEDGERDDVELPQGLLSRVLREGGAFPRVRGVREAVEQQRRGHGVLRELRAVDPPAVHRERHGGVAEVRPDAHAVPLQALSAAGGVDGGCCDGIVGVTGVTDVTGVAGEESAGALLVLLGDAEDGVVKAYNDG